MDCGRNANLICSGIWDKHLPPCFNPLCAKWKYVLSYLVLPNFWTNIAVWKVPKLCPFVISVRATCGWRWWWWRISGKIQVRTKDTDRREPKIPTGENQRYWQVRTKVLEEKLIPQRHWPPHMDRPRIERGPQHSETVTDSYKPQLYLNIQSVPRSKHFSLIKTNTLMLYREINCCLFWEL